MSAISLTRTRSESFLNATNRETGAGSMILSNGEVRSFDGHSAGCLIRVAAGTVWITQSGDIRDIVLSQGESIRITRPGRVLVESLTPQARIGVIYSEAK